MITRRPLRDEAMVEMAIGEYGSYLPFVHLRREGYTRT